MLELILKRWILTSILICIGVCACCPGIPIPLQPLAEGAGHLAAGGSEMAGLAGGNDKAAGKIQEHQPTGT